MIHIYINGVCCLRYSDWVSKSLTWTNSSVQHGQHRKYARDRTVVEIRLQSLRIN